MNRSLAAIFALLSSAQAVHADFVPIVLDQFDGNASYSVTRDLGYSSGAGDIAGANWAGFGAASGTKAFRASFDAGSTGYASNTVFGSMQQSDGALRLGLAVPTGAVLASGGASPSNVRVTYAGSFDLSGKGGRFYFHLASTSAPDSSLGVGILSEGIWYVGTVATGPAGPRYLEIAFDSLLSATGSAYAGNGAAVNMVAIGLMADTSISSDRSAQLSEFGVVPTPATAALLGAAFVAHRRRRR